MAKYLNEAMAKIDFNGASLAPVEVKEEPKEPKKKARKVKEPSSSSSSEMTPVPKKKKRVKEEVVMQSLTLTEEPHKSPMMKKRRSSVAFGSTLPKQVRQSHSRLSHSMSRPQSKGPNIIVDGIDGNREQHALLDRSESGSTINARPDMDHMFDGRSSSSSSVSDICSS